MANAIERGRQQRERRQHLRVAIALENLRGRRRRLEPEPLARRTLDLRVGGGVRADGARELAHAQPLERPDEALAVAVEPEAPTQPA